MQTWSIRRPGGLQRGDRVCSTHEPCSSNLITSKYLTCILSINQSDYTPVDGLLPGQQPNLTERQLRAQVGRATFARQPSYLLAESEQMSHLPAIFSPMLSIHGE